MALGQGGESFKHIARRVGRIMLRFLGVGEEYIQRGQTGVLGWFAGATIPKGITLTMDQAGNIVRRAPDMVFERPVRTLFRRYGGIQLRVGQIYAGIRLPFWLINLPFKAGDGVVDYSRRRLV